MKKIAVLSFAALAALVATGPGYADDDDDGRHRSQSRGNWIGVDELSQRLVEQGYSAIREIERDDGRYEVEARNADGHRVELKVSRSGDVIRVKRDDDDDDRWDD